MALLLVLLAVNNSSAKANSRILVPQENQQIEEGHEQVLIFSKNPSGVHRGHCHALREQSCGENIAGVRIPTSNFGREQRHSPPPRHAWGFSMIGTL